MFFSKVFHIIGFAYWIKQFLFKNAYYIKQKCIFAAKYKRNYLTQVQKVVSLILEIELPQLRQVDVGNVRKLRSLLAVLSRGVPFAVENSQGIV